MEFLWLIQGESYDPVLASFALAHRFWSDCRRVLQINFNINAHPTIVLCGLEITFRAFFGFLPLGISGGMVDPLACAPRPVDGEAGLYRFRTFGRADGWGFVDQQAG